MTQAKPITVHETRHYSPVTNRWYVQTDPAERLWAKVDKSGDCWLWTGRTVRRGYGTLRAGGRAVMAHRLAYELLVGPLAANMQLDHLCRNRACVNPRHLEPVTCRENLLRGDTLNARNAAKSVCLRGHPLSGENLYLFGGRRHCRTCRRGARARAAA